MTALEKLDRFVCPHPLWRQAAGPTADVPCGWRVMECTLCLKRKLRPIPAEELSEEDLCPQCQRETREDAPGTQNAPLGAVG